MFPLKYKKHVFKRRVPKTPALILLAFFVFTQPTVAFGAFGDGASTSLNPNLFTGHSSTLRVDGPTGAFTQSVPIRVPPGRNGMHPGLKLEYNSQNINDGMFGYGWDISIPYIYRFNKTGTQDFYSNPTFASTVDGELVATASTTYRARTDTGDYHTYIYVNNTWMMFDKNGTRYLFGSNDDGRQYDTSATSSEQTYKWVLQEMRDVNDNYVSFEYSRNANQLYPDQITYTGHSSTDGPFTIDFATTTRSDVRESYATGFKVTTNYLISQIDVSIEGTLVNKYVLSYGTGHNGYRSLLTSIQQTGYDESSTGTTLPAMSFAYTNSSNMFIDESDDHSGNGMKALGPQYIVTDFNGNGIPDIANSYYAVDDIPAAQHGWWYVDQLGSSGYYQNQSAPEYWAFQNTSAIQWQAEEGVRLLDVNGDGKADILKGFEDGGTGSTTRTVYLNDHPAGVYTWTATTSYSGQIPIFSYSSGGTNKTTGIFGEINGDGYTDFVISLSGYEDNTYTGNGSAWATSTAFAAVFQMDSTSGKASQLVDINGDRLADWVYADDDNTYVRLNNGSGWESSVSSQWTIATSTYYKSVGASTEYYDRGIRFQDINGDGLVDFVRSYGVSENAACSGTPPPEYADFSHVFLNTGNGWATSTAYTFSSSITGGWLNSGNSPCGPLAIRNNEHLNWTGNGQMNQDVITTVTSPQGGHKSVLYDITTQLGNNDELPVSLLVVTDIGEYDGFGNAATTSYAYADGKLYLTNKKDKRFAGFAVSTTTAPDSITATYYHQGDDVDSSLGEQNDGFAQINRPFREDTFDLSSNLLKRTYYKWTTDTVASSTLVALGQEMNFNYGSGGIHKDSATAYTYATSTRDVTKITEYGEVTGSTNGTFTDTGTDKRITDISYAATTTVATTTTSSGGGATNTHSLDFESSSSQYASRADTSSLSITGAITVEAWVNPETIPGNGDGFDTIISKWDGSGTRGYRMYIDYQSSGSRLCMYIDQTGNGTGGARAISCGTATDLASPDLTGTWVHLAASWVGNNSDTADLFINGVEESTKVELDTGATGLNDENQTTRIGAVDSAINNEFDGIIDDVRVWNTTRTPSEISDNYEQELTGSESGLVAYWKLNNDADDITANANDLTLNNSPTFVTDVPFTGGGSSSTTTVLYTLRAPSQETVTNQSATKITENKYYYDGLAHGEINTGNRTKVEGWEIGSTYVDEEFAYNSFGLVASSTDPRGKVTTNTYDSYNLYVASSTNPLSQQTQFYYDYTLGKPKKTIDVNSREFETVFDGLDRPLTEKQPDISTPSTLVTKKTYTYTDTVGSRKVVETNYLDGSTNFTLHRYLDGLDKVIQTRKEAEATDEFSVKDLVYNPVTGLLTKESLPYFSSGSSKTSATTTDTLYTNYTYDALQRPLTIANAVGTTTKSYDRWTVTVTDALSNVKDYVYDAYDRLAQVDEHDGASEYTTTYTYDVIGNLTKIVDAESNERSFTYDGLSRRLTAQDLHDAADGTYGTWTYTYDDAGNLASRVDSKSQTVNFTYDDINRVLTEDYTGDAGTEVEYDYDDCTEGVGRLCIATSTDAVNTFAYDALGNTVTETKTVDSTEYVTTFTHDRQSNITNIKYPDDAEVSYTYNTAGLLESIAHKESGESFLNLVSDFDYAPTEQVTFKSFVNGLQTTYTYDSNALYRLTNILTDTSGGGGGGGGAFLNGLWNNIAKATEELPLAIARTLNFSFLAVADDTTPEEIVPTDPTPDPQVIEEPAPAVVEELVAEPEPIPEPVEEVVVEETPEPIIEESAPTTTEEDVTPDTSTTTPTIIGPVVESEVATTSPQINEEETATTTQLVLIEEVATSTPETEPSLLESVGAASSTATNTLDNALDAQATSTATTTALISDPEIASSTEEVVEIEIFDDVRSLLTEKGASERTIIKSREIAKLQSITKTSRENYKIEILSIEEIPGGVQAFARAWNKDGRQIGFGSDGSVDIERFRIFNPPIFVPDPKETYTREWIDEDTGERHVVAYREDLKEALLQVIEHNLSVMKNIHGNENIVPGKRGRTTSTFYPDADSESTSVDGYLQSGNSNSWDTVHDASSGNYSASDSDTFVFVGVRHEDSGTEYRIQRGVFLFDTSALSESTTVTAATLSLYATTNQSNDDNDGNDFIAIVDTSLASNTALVQDDYDQVGDAINNPTEMHDSGQRKDITSITTNAYLDFTLNSTGISNVSLTGVSKFGAREGHDILDDAIDSGGNDSNHQFFSSADASGTTQDPKLVVEHDTTGSIPSAPTALLVEGETNPTQVTDTTPEFSAIYNDPDGDDSSAAYQIQVDTATDFDTPFWDSTKTAMATTSEGIRSPDISYSGSSLASTTVYFWRIRFWDEVDNQGEWSAHGAFSLGGGNPTISTGIQDISFTYDAVGNITQVTDTSNTDARKTITYSYDDLYRLAEAYTTIASSSPFSRSYTYNKIGNITNKSDLGDYTYGETGYANPHAVTDVNGVTYSYDNNGNLTNFASTTNSWDYINRLTATHSSSSPTTFYGYDHTTQRVFRGNGTATSTFANRYYNYKTTGATTTATTTKHVFTPSGELIATIETVGATTTKKYIHTDHLGGTNVVSDENGDVDKTLDYYPFGSDRISTGNTNEQRTFIGEERDSETGFSYLNARYYDGGRGQFMSQDPNFWTKINLSEPQTQNSYSYASNNPISKKDPTGLATEEGQREIQRQIKISQQQFYDRLNKLGDEARKTYLESIGGFIDPFGGVRSITNPNLSIPQRIGAGIGVGLGVLGGPGNAGKALITTGKTVSGLKVTEHAAKRFTERQMSREQVEEAFKTGTQYLDQKTGNILYVVGERGKGGYSIATDVAQKVLVTVQNFVPKLTDRFKPF